MSNCRVNYKPEEITYHVEEVFANVS